MAELTLEALAKRVEELERRISERDAARLVRRELQGPSASLWC